MKTILLVDDTETVLFFEQMVLRSEGYELLVARDGYQAIEMVQKNRPDLVLLDVMMPRLNGIETCHELKQSPTTSAIPVIMVTTLGQPDMVEKAFAAGCDDYLTKPINKLELMTKIRIHLS